ncbi:MAG TPA: DmsC/YnfH family molybdoenzyme membrane anchor subunit, partial [Dongiaceae bacterium]|nr:DmsC/YnfH family molybdoenzyme membrane anchor subunit [Dongiaceae bacterium]
LLGVAAVLGRLPAAGGLAFTAMALALALISGGLLSSTLHLGHPERAWRAVSQWRTSWLSREGVLSLATFVPAGLFAVGWLFEGERWGWWGLLAALLAIATVCATAMIYASLKPIRAWNNLWTLPGYLAMGLATGSLWFTLWAEVAPVSQPRAFIIAVVALGASALLKRGYWRFLDTNPHAATAETATGLGRIGKVRMLAAPHTEENYLMKEMGFRIARKHAEKLRHIAIIAGFLAPLVLTLLAMILPDIVGIILLVLAVLSNAVGTLTERWLFFAEAKHTVTLYYGAETA